MTAYDAAEWSDLFVATAGATAALAGLLFVAVSINLERILKFEGLPERALETLVMLLSALLVSIAGLVPAQGETALGFELLFVGMAAALAIFRLPTGLGGGEEPRAWLWSRWALRLAGTLPFVAGALSLLAGAGGGLYWIAAAIALAIVAAVANAWVLLVEILR